MSSILKITWQGDVPGLGEHRVSLSEFGGAISQLLVAYRRIASNMLRDATEGEKLADKRLRHAAKWLDLQIETVIEGSAGLQIVAVTSPPPGVQLPLFEDLARRTGEALLSAVEAESKGMMRSAAVRKYLGKLPQGVTGQSYVFEGNGSSKKVEVGTMKLPKALRETPHLQEVEGFIVSVGFEPGRPFVQFETDEGKIKCQASADAVERALELRDGAVTGLIVKRLGDRRLLNLWPSESPPKPLSAEELDDAIFGKWDGLLRRLAE